MQPSQTLTVASAHSILVSAPMIHLHKLHPPHLAFVDKLRASWWAVTLLDIQVPFDLQELVQARPALAHHSLRPPGPHRPPCVCHGRIRPGILQFVSPYTLQRRKARARRLPRNASLLTCYGGISRVLRGTLDTPFPTRPLRKRPRRTSARVPSAQSARAAKQLPFFDHGAQTSGKNLRRFALKDADFDQVKLAHLFRVRGLVGLLVRNRYFAKTRLDFVIFFRRNSAHCPSARDKLFRRSEKHSRSAASRSSRPIPRERSTPSNSRRVTESLSAIISRGFTMSAVRSWTNFKKSA